MNHEHKNAAYEEGRMRAFDELEANNPYSRASEPELHELWRAGRQARQYEAGLLNVDYGLLEQKVWGLLFAQCPAVAVLDMHRAPHRATTALVYGDAAPAQEQIDEEGAGPVFGEAIYGRAGPGQLFYA